MPQEFDPYHQWLGIPPEDQPPHHYRLLGIPVFEENAEVIQTAADRQMAHLRTYQTGPNAVLAQKLLNEVAAARVCLLREDKKAAYDIQLRSRLAPPVVGDTPAPVVLPVDVGADWPSSSQRARLTRGKGGPIFAAVGIGAMGLAVLALLAFAWRGRPAAAPAVVQAPGDRLGPSSDGKTASAAASPAAAKPPVEKRLEPPPAPKKADPGAPEDPNSPLRSDPGTDRTPPPPVGKSDDTGESGKSGDADRADGMDDAEDATPAPEGAAQPTRPPVPDATTQQRIRQQIDDLYNTSAKKTAAEKLALAAELVRLARNPEGKADEAFGLLSRSAELAAEAGDAAATLVAVEALSERFEIDGPALKDKMLARCAERVVGPAATEAFVSAAEAVIDEMASDERFDLALSVASACDRLTERPSGRALRKEVHARFLAVRRLHERWLVYRKALEQLKASPEDRDANLAVGAWRCFVA
ncbi:MAG: hypothetical protein NUV77_04185, partial [Thermoguttaceae bacterium]|nr:hypothetical protein [Thermoguttaceae bacterium]